MWLSIDWDYFIDDALVDVPRDSWDARTSAQVWALRRRDRLAVGLAPRADFTTLRHIRRLIVAEHHAAIVPFLRRATPDTLISLDAHHDGGYEDDTLRTVHSGNWAAWAAAHGWDVRLVLPEWRAKYAPEPAPTLARPKPHALPLPRTVDVAFLCRSPAWTPPWFDGEFERLVRHLSCYAGSVRRAEPTPRR